MQKSAAKRKGIPFELSFEEWWAWWQVDDRWSRRGNAPESFVMARFKDIGPYAAWNIYCTTKAGNLNDWRKWQTEARGEPLTERLDIVVTDPQLVWLKREMDRLGIRVGEVIRRLLDQVRDAARDSK